MFCFVEQHCGPSGSKDSFVPAPERLLPKLVQLARQYKLAVTRAYTCPPDDFPTLLVLLAQCIFLFYRFTFSIIPPHSFDHPMARVFFLRTSLCRVAVQLEEFFASGKCRKKIPEIFKTISRRRIFPCILCF